MAQVGVVYPAGDGDGEVSGSRADHGGRRADRLDLRAATTSARIVQRFQGAADERWPASLGVSLENVRLFEQTRTLLAETEQRAGELSVINSVQQGLASKLEMQAIIDLVGDKLCEVVSSDSLDIRLYDRQANLVSFPYFVERGSRMELPAIAPGGLSAHVLRTCQPLVINENIEERMAELGSYTLPGTETEKSLAAVPIVAGGQPIGLITTSNYERENAFSESDVRAADDAGGQPGRIARERAPVRADRAACWPRPSCAPRS